MTSPTTRPTDPCAVRTVGLGKRYGRTWAVQDLDLRIRPGTVFGLLGPNGAGKSTTIRMLLGLARPSSGRAEVFGVDAADVVRAHRQLAHVPADVALWPHLSGAQVLHLLAATGPGTDEAYRAELVERFALDPSKRARTYSTGNRQKVALVAAFATRAPLLVLVLDEPTSGLDPLVEREFHRAVTCARDRGQTVLLSSHRLDEVEAVCDEVGIVRAGRLVEAGPLSRLRGLHRTEVSATFTGPAPRLAGLPGVSVLETADPVGPRAPGRVRFTVSGPPGAALAALAGAGVSALSVHEPSLEEVFLDHYGAGEPERCAPGTRDGAAGTSGSLR
ncbi:ABC transporter ATP-binding protein [Kineococcus sp. SYSU DK001]|uniref:ABC transporter ATP-binding protein n=1 Tax=Kineococcus sp. SYSU DK001 TaxID=3383122 RepID=UPI003D7E1F10